MRRLVPLIGLSVAALISVPTVGHAAPDGVADGAGTPQATQYGMGALVPMDPASQSYANVMAALHGEAYAYVRYTDFAWLATQNGQTTLASTYTAIASVELNKHFASEAPFVDLVGTTDVNLQNAVAAETNENTTLYPQFAEQAKAAGDTAAYDLFTDVTADEGVHAANFTAALAVLNGDPTATMPANPVADTVDPKVGPAGVKSQQTLDNLLTAAQGEALAYVKYMDFATEATQAGYPQIASLLEATASVERYEHFREFTNLMGLWGDDLTNLTNTITAEIYESVTKDPGYAATATTEGYMTLANVFTSNGADEGNHAVAYSAALAKLNPPKVTPVDSASTSYANVMTALHGEAMAYAKYSDFAVLATANGHPDVASQFTKTAAVELNEHFAEEAPYVGLVGTTSQNLADALAGETNENTTLYPGFADQAKAAGDMAAYNLFMDIAGDEGVHANNYRDALSVLAGDQTVTMPANPVPDPVDPIPGPAGVKSQQTLDNLMTAAEGEAFAYAKYMAFADEATQAGYPEIASLFQATASVERYEHFREFTNLMGLWGDDPANLTNAINGETYETTTMYPGFAATAQTEGYTALSSRLTEIAGDEANHAAGFQSALTTLQASAANAQAPATTKTPATSSKSAPTGGTLATTGTTALPILLILMGAAVGATFWRTKRQGSRS